MAKFRSFRKIEKPGSVGCSGIFLLLVSNFQFVAPSVTWKAPHPQWNQTDPNDIRTVDKQVLNGSTQVPLRWRYTLLSGSMTSTIFSIRLKDGSFSDIGMISGGKIVIFDKRDFRTRFDISVHEQATLIINRVTGTEDEVYQCKLTTDSNQWSHRIRVIVTVPASLTNVSRDQTVREDSNMKLFCEAIGKPTSNITWTRELEDGSNGEVLHQGSTWDFPKIKRTDAGTYKCTAYNGFGAKVSQVFKVNVTYPPIVFEVSATRQDVEVQESVSLECTAEGNPPPNYTWMPCNERVCHESKLVISEVLYDDVYVCTVTNSLGSDSGNVSIFIGGKVINVTLVITSESCTDGKYNQSSLWTKLEKTIDEVFANESRYTSVQLRDARCGSVTTDLVLKFSSTIQERQVIDILRNAAKNGMLGELNVNVSSIIGTRPTVKTTTTAAATTPSSPSDSKMGIILIAVLVPLVSLLVTAGVAAWCMYRKRKCKRRETKVHNNGFSGEAGGEVQEQAYVQVTSGCEGRPNRHSGGGNPSSVPPVLYDTAQNGNRGADKAQYAVVDKFKRKPKTRRAKVLPLLPIVPLKHSPLMSTPCKDEPRGPNKDPQAVTRNGRGKGQQFFFYL